MGKVPDRSIYLPVFKYPQMNEKQVKIPFWNVFLFFFVHINTRSGIAWHSCPRQSEIFSGYIPGLTPIYLDFSNYWSLPRHTLLHLLQCPIVSKEFNLNSENSIQL